MHRLRPLFERRGGYSEEQQRLAGPGRVRRTAIGTFTQEDPIGLAGGLNLYGFASGDPVNFGDAFGLAADTIQVQVVRTGPTQYHTSIRIAPDDGTPAYTLGAGPKSVGRALLGRLTPLVSNRNRAGDTGPQAWRVTVDPGAQGDAAAIRNLQILDAIYCDCLPYELEPEPGDPNYNSNGYTRGMLERAGLPVPKIPYHVPGWEKPIPLPTWRP